MRHLIALSLKYMCRQKLRTTLTAICIVLSVFILNLFAVAGSTLHKSLVNTLEAEQGRWEFDASYLLDAEDAEQLADKENLLKHHPAVSDYYFEDSATLFMPTARDAQDGIGFLEIQTDDNDIVRHQYLEMWVAEGNDALVPENQRVGQSTSLQKGEVLLSQGELALRYAIGDTITLRITPVYAVIDDSIPQIMELRETIAKINANENLDYILLNDGTDEGKVDTTEFRRHIMAYNMIEAMKRYGYSLNDLELQSMQRGETMEITLTVAGFFPRQPVTPDIALHVDDSYLDKDFTLPGIIFSREDMVFAQSVENAAMSLFSTVNPEIPGINHASIRYGCITKSVSFLDGLQMVVDSFNQRKAENAADLVIEESALNTELLEAQLRYIRFDSNILVIGAFAALALLLIWGFARFIIDNAFEISVLERTRQFATLRIMGASKKQLLTLVFTEATAYTLLSLIIGMAAAVGTTQLGVHVLFRTNLEHVEFSVYGWLWALTVVLSVLAIYISAYTSAMYASRNLSLKQATHLNKPKTAKRTHAIRKTQRGFLYRYAWKNIKRTRRSLVVSTVAMTLGMTFSVAMAVGLVALALRTASTQVYDGDVAADNYISDFSLISKNAAAYTQMLDHCEENPNYRSLSLMDTVGVMFRDREKTPALNKDEPVLMWIRVIDEKRYDRDLYPVTGLAYQDWLQSNQALLAYGFPDIIIPTPASDPRNTMYQSATYAPASSVFGDAEPLIYGDSTVTLGFQLRKPIGIAGCITATEDTDQTDPTATDDETQSEQGLGYSLLMPVEMYYRYEPSAQISVEVAANRNADYDTMIAELDALCDQTNGLSYQDYYYENTGYVEQMLSVFAVLAIIVISVWLAGVLTMVNSLHTNVLNRHAELRMLRTMGCSIKQIKKMLVAEGMLFSATSSILGCGLGLLYACKFGGIANETDFVGVGAIIIGVMAVVFGVNLLISMLCAKPGMKRLMERPNDI